MTSANVHIVEIQEYVRKRDILLLATKRDSWQSQWLEFQKIKAFV
jgi:hypothetical protein